MKSLRYFIVLCFIFLAAKAQGITKTWIGGSGSWNTAGNWSPSGVPGTGDDIIIDSGSPTYSGNFTVGSTGSVTISNGATFTVTGKFILDGDGQLILDGGTLEHTGSQFNFPYSSISNVIINSGTLNTTATNFQVNSKMEMHGGYFNAYGGLAVASGKTFEATAGIIKVTGLVDIKSTGATFHAGNDSMIITGRLNVETSCNFYADTSVLIVNGAGNGATSNLLYGNFYAGNARVIFNPTATSDIGSGGIFYGNTATVFFNDVASIGNTGQLYVQSANITFTKDLTVSQSGTINAGDGTLLFEGDANFQNSGTLDAGSAEITFEGNASFLQSGTLNGGTSTLNFEGDASFSNSGILNASSSEVNFGGNVTISNNGGTINADSSTITLSGNLDNSGTFNAGTSTVVLDGDSTQTISNDITFYNLDIQTDGEVISGGNLTVNNTTSIDSGASISVTDPNDQLNFQGDLIDSSGGGIVTAKPFVTSISASSSTVIIVNFNQAVTSATATNPANITFPNFTLSNLSLIDTNKLQFTVSPAITSGVEYTLTFQNIANTLNPPGIIATGHTKKFTWVIPQAPTTQSSNLQFSNITSDSVTLSWTKGNGARLVIIARQNDTVNYLPVNATSYTANSIFGSGTAFQTNNYIVYEGTGSTFTLKGLSGGNTYHFAIYEYNGSSSLIVYNFVNPLKDSILIPNNPPTGQASNLVLSSNSDTSMVVRWTRGNGSGIVVIARESTSITQTPSAGVDYLSASNFGAGDTLAEGAYVVYKGTNDSVEITGLSPNKTYFFTAFEYQGSGTAIAYNVTANPVLSAHTFLRVQLTVFLEGPFNGTKMLPNLNTVLPSNQVYSSAPWSYSGTESVSVLPNDSIIDWILVELRQVSAPGEARDTSIVSRRAGFLLSNGSIVDTNGYSPLLMPTERPGRMYAVIYHRTHLPVLSADSLALSNGLYVYNLSTSVGAAYGTAPLKSIGGGKYGMYSGRVASSTNNDIGSSDAAAAWEDRNLVGYYDTDVNLDGLVDAGDRSQIWNNLGSTSEVVQ